MEHIRLWPMLLKDDVFNTVNEFNTLETHGSSVAFFHPEGALPAEDDSVWRRNYKQIRSMGCTRRYSIMSSMVRMAHSNSETHQTLGGTMWVLEQLERSLFSADSSLLSVSIDGLDAQMNNVRDLRGKPLTGDEVNYGAGLVFDSPNYGKATDLFMPVGADTDFIDDVAPNARYNVNQQGYTNGHAGMQIKVYDTQRGPIALQPDVFVSFGDVPSAVALGDAAKRPGVPVESVALAAGASATSQFVASDVGAYRYKVVAVNAYGKSIPLSLTGTITPTAGQAVTFSIGDGTPVAEYYEVYRSTRGGAIGTCKLAFRIARDTSGVTVITDNNADLPGTGRAYLLQMNKEFMVFQRLLRFMKIRLGLVDASYRFMLLLFGQLAVHAGNKGLIFKNLARSSRSPSYDV